MNLHDKKFEIFLSSKKISARIKTLAETINKDYSGKSPLFMPILNGSFMFAADLMKKIKLECSVSFIKVASYSKMESTGNLKELIGINENIFKKDIILVEDIIDSGTTIKNLREKLIELGPNSIEIVSLLVKPEALKEDIDLKYIGFEIPDKFVVGYGLDYEGLGRNFKDIYQVKK